MVKASVNKRGSFQEGSRLLILAGDMFSKGKIGCCRMLKTKPSCYSLAVWERVLTKQIAIGESMEVLVVDIVLSDWKIKFQGFIGGLCVKEDEGMLIRPPPEPPPWRNSATRVWTSISISTESIVFCFYFISIVFCCLFILCCKTFALGLGDERSVVIVVILNMPKLGLASYIALSKVINSESRPRAYGYMWSFCYFNPFLSAFYE
ncbi:unnamed protein product [Cuscuta epithymum]|uniref:Uncharacterized protein n=1 Tax=Cuscuta epithymum TaxID=186058 RepID=A0AAV0CQ45_9ASTE|nr:unnamed protein product [Cuscuta epithymum]